MSKIITCLNSWQPSFCCPQEAQEYIHGVRIKDGRSIIATHRYPFTFKLNRSTLIIIEKKVDYHYHLSQFSQSYVQIRSLLVTCLFAGTVAMVRKKVEYTVNAGAQQTFLTPLSGNESYAGGADYYEVFVNGQQVGEGTTAFMYTIVAGNVFFTVPLPDLTPTPELGEPIIVNITYWVNE